MDLGELVVAIAERHAVCGAGDGDQRPVLERLDGAIGEGERGTQGHVVSIEGKVGEPAAVWEDDLVEATGPVDELGAVRQPATGQRLDGDLLPCRVVQDAPDVRGQAPDSFLGIRSLWSNLAQP